MTSNTQVCFALFVFARLLKHAHRLEGKDLRGLLFDITIRDNYVYVLSNNIHGNDIINE